MINFYKDDEAFTDSQGTEMKLASESFIPSGMFTPDDRAKRDEGNGDYERSCYRHTSEDQYVYRISHIHISLLKFKAVDLI